MNIPTCPPGDFTYNALKNLIFASSEIQSEDHAPNLLERSVKGYINEYCTINIKTARRGGHTTSSLRVAFELFPSVAFFSINSQMADRMAGIMDAIVSESEDELVHSRTRNMIATASKYDNKIISRYFFYGLDNRENMNIVSMATGYELDAIIVDPAFDVSDSKRDAFVQLLSEKSLSKDYRFLIYVG
jgi:hypothetical protein